MVADLIVVAAVFLCAAGFVAMAIFAMLALTGAGIDKATKDSEELRHKPEAPTTRAC